MSAPVLPRRSLLRGLAAVSVAGAAGAVADVVAAATPNPTFALIEKHRVAALAFEAAVAVDDGEGPDVDRASFAEQEAHFDMHEVAPTTVAGLGAYVAYWHEHTQRDRFALESIGWEAIPTIAEAMAALFPAGGKGGAA